MPRPPQPWRWPALLLAGASVGVWLLIAQFTPRPGGPLPPLGPGPAPVAAAGEAAVRALQGQVEFYRDGGWTPLTRASALGREERIRTGEAARVVLALPQGTVLDLDESAELAVHQVSERLQRLDLEQGRLVAEQRQPGLTVEVRGKGGARATSTAPARFAVRETGAALVVATETGRVNLGAAGKRVEVGAGEQALARRGAAPSAPAQLPVEVLLEVASRLAEEGRCLVEAEVPEGAELRLAGGGAPLLAGKVHQLVPGGPGQQIPYEVRDLLGRRKTGAVRCSADPVRADTVDRLGFE